MQGLSRTRPSVIQRAKDGDAGELARLYAPLAFAMARKLGLSENDADDVAQQTMMELLRMLPDFEYDPSRSFKGLIRRIVANKRTDALRRRQPIIDNEQLQAIADESQERQDEVLDREWIKGHLMAALDRIRCQVIPTTFQSFQLCVLEEWPIEKVANTLGLSKNQVSANKLRVIRRLRDHLLEEGVFS